MPHVLPGRGDEPPLVGPRPRGMPQMRADLAGRPILRPVCRPGGGKMWYGAAADLVVVVHLLFIGFVVGGAFVAWRWPRITWAHLRRWCTGPWSSSPASPARSCCWRTTCATTPGSPGTVGVFITQYLVRVVYPPGLTRGMQIRPGVLVLLAAITGYGGFLRRQMPGRDRAAGGRPGQSA
jgi:hypothetical protein